MQACRKDTTDSAPLTLSLSESALTLGARRQGSGGIRAGTATHEGTVVLELTPRRVNWSNVPPLTGASQSFAYHTTCPISKSGKETDNFLSARSKVLSPKGLSGRG